MKSYHIRTVITIVLIVVEHEVQACSSYCTMCIMNTCSGCNVGSYASAGSCQPCSPGTFMASIGGTCGTCGSGKFTPNSGMASCGWCTSCSLGKYELPNQGCTSTADRVCDPCPSGNYGTFSGSFYATCTLCPLGNYAPSTGLTACIPCTSPTTTGATGQTTCNACVDNYWWNTVGNVCTYCGTVGSTKNCPADNYAICTNYATKVSCSVCTGHQSPYCATGQEPDRVCDGGGLVNSACVNCPASKEKKISTAWCTGCETGYYKSASGAGNCLPCTKAPVGGVYTAWLTVDRSTDSCPWTCKSGYYGNGLTCIACNTTAGKYSNIQGKTACSDCTNAMDVQSYYQTPTTFDGLTNACPWDCNVGYVKSGSSCVLCQTPTYKSTAVKTQGSNSVCTTCKNCLAVGVEYQSGVCNATQDRQCEKCGTRCMPGQYIDSYCISLTNISCVACATRCQSGQFLSSVRCGGETTTDVVRSNCMSCLVPQNCTSGYYLSGQCAGTESSSNECKKCSEDVVAAGCRSDQYYGGCSGYNNTRCLNITACPAGQYRYGKTYQTPGICRNCSTCTTSGLNQSRACGIFEDTVCAGVRCGSNLTCASSFETKFYCDYGIGKDFPTCGICPSGYDSDGQFCVECPEGKTCDRRGQVACEGQCAALRISECDTVVGYAKCVSALCNPNTDDSKEVTRGSYMATNMAAECIPYFQCTAGYYKRFTDVGVVQCEPCVGVMPAYAVWTTAGLSVNDGSSCLWGCPGRLSKTNANKTGCVLLPSRDKQIDFIRAGWWKGGSCGIGKTSEAGGALFANECLDCPPLPSSATWIAGGVLCEWGCATTTGLVQRGGLCVDMQAGLGPLCKTRGFTLPAGGGNCIATGYPWNRPGYSKSGWTPIVIEGVGITSSMVEVGLLATVEANGWIMRSTSMPYGLRGRHVIKESNIANSSNIVRNWTVDGPICSMTRTWIGGNEYVIGAVCNQSLILYLNLSIRNPRLEVLIGSSKRGWANGFKTQALFQSELYVTKGKTNNTVYVLDRWNCMVREVVIAGEPGGYLTRVYTVHGLETKFINSRLWEPKCYGDGGLASPRRFWPLRDQWVAFAVDNGLYQFNIETRELVWMDGESNWNFPTESLKTVSSLDEFTLVLVFWDGSRATIKALETQCPDDTTSLAGGDCSTGCVLAEGRFVNQTSGLCIDCLHFSCGVGQMFVPCSRTEQGFCKDCDNGDPGIFIEPGTCDRSFKRLVPPCLVGFYRDVRGDYCSQCPSLTSTVYAGAVRPEQCKCLAGLVKRNGQCVAEPLYEFEGLTDGSELACAVDCGLPRNARLLAGSGVACKWECNTGFYHDTGAGWSDKCRPCWLVNSSSAIMTTRGDDDSPWSCENS